MEEISKRPDIRTQTCTVRTREGRLLDLGVLRQAVEDLGIGARLRGVEAEVEGELAWRSGELVLRLAGSEDVLLLDEYRHPIQWEFRKKRARRIRREERGAFRSLLRGAGTTPRRVSVTGPLWQDECRDGLVLEVRDFKWLKQQPSPSRSVVRAAP